MSNEIIENENYEYRDVPITPSIVEAIIVKLFNGRMVKRDEIIKAVLKYHIENGGKGANAQNFTSSVKKALSNLNKKSIAQKKAYGQWSFSDNSKEIIEVDSIKDEKMDRINIPINKFETFGIGKESVYLYYFKAYRENSELKSENIWPCKIGRTEIDPLDRVLSQASTGISELPHIAFIVYTDDSSNLEKYLHAALKLRNRHLGNSPGKEWFNTNPEEVLEIIRFINNDILLQENSI